MPDIFITVIFHVRSYRDIYMGNTIFIFIKIISLIFAFNKYAYSSLTLLSIVRDIYAQDKNLRLMSELNQRKELQNQVLKKGSNGNSIRKMELNS